MATNASETLKKRYNIPETETETKETETKETETKETETKETKTKETETKETKTSKVKGFLHKLLPQRHYIDFETRISTYWHFKTFGVSSILQRMLNGRWEVTAWVNPKHYNKDINSITPQLLYQESCDGREMPVFNQDISKTYEKLKCSECGNHFIAEDIWICSISFPDRIVVASQCSECNYLRYQLIDDDDFISILSLSTLNC